MKIIIMGASSGLGAGLARLFMEKGHEVACAARSVERIGPCTVRAAIDINRPDAPEELARLARRLGGMDLYIHVAGIGYDSTELDPAREAETVQTDCTGFARMVSAAFNLLAASGKPGAIAAISSVAGTKGIGCMEAYSASKRFDSTYLQGLRQRAVNMRLPISITDIRPGWTRTPLLKPGKNYPLLMNPDKVCRAIAGAIERRRKVAIIDRRWALLVFFWRLLPDCVWRHFKTGAFT